jgi:pyridoxine/pyridoxamine 5'-phosphate oxidase
MIQQDFGAIAREIIDANLYMVLGTADEQGQPWVAPVYFAAAGYRELYWISSPEAAHSRNIARRPEVSVVVFNSQAPIFTGQAVYMSAVAEQLAGADVEHGLEVYPGRPEAGPMTAEDVQPPNPYRMYRATVSRHWILCPRDFGPCVPHGLAFDHRAEATL